VYEVTRHRVLQSLEGECSRVSLVDSLEEVSFYEMRLGCLKQRDLKTCSEVTHFVIFQGLKLVTMCLAGSLISWFRIFFESA
jgi:hypothetical protein